MHKQSTPEQCPRLTLQALRLYMGLEQRFDVVVVLVDTARLCLAVQDTPHASALLLKASTLLDQVRQWGGCQ
jgi:hypothetical protein